MPRCNRLVKFQRNNFLSSFRKHYSSTITLCNQFFRQFSNTMDRCNKCHLKELRGRRGRTSRQGQTERCFSVDSWNSSTASRRRLGRRKIDLSTLTPPLYQLPHRRSLNFARACAQKMRDDASFWTKLGGAIISQNSDS